MVGLEVSVARDAAPEEIDDALGALSLAYRLTEREAGFLLNETAARSYLEARRFSNHHHFNQRKEN